ncbi:hypothetical protein, partial [Salmonella sp. s55004]|uniref:hypothetical protein n=1 Tax=Salmonella sp. s55004 TaxID=3159675 RepID=UPI00397FE21F
METLPDDFKNPRGVDELRMSGNPWNCDCNLRWIVDKKTQFINYTITDPPNCQSPASLTGHPIFQLNEDEFACIPYREGSSQVNIIGSTEVECPLTANPPNPEIRWDV